MDREQIHNLKVGDLIERDLLGTGQYTLTVVTEIFGRGTDLKGNAYICLYTRFSETSQISTSVTEGETRLRIPTNPDLTCAAYRAYAFANYEAMSREALTAFLDANDPSGVKYNDIHMLHDIGETLAECELHDAVRTLQDAAGV